MTQKIIKIDPAQYQSLLIEFESEAPPPDPLPPKTKLIDVSRWQGSIDWERVRNVAQVGHAMIRASQGTTKDSLFSTNWDASKLAGIKRGAYHYWQNEIVPQAQMDKFVGAMMGDFGELPWALDIEDGIPPFTVNEIPDVMKFLELVEVATGKGGYIYTGASVWNFPSEDWATDYPLWLAAYNNTGYAQLKPWFHPYIWQHTSRGVIPGITANTVDLNTSGDGLTPIIPDWWWRGTTSERKGTDGKHPHTFFVRAISSFTPIYDSPSGSRLTEMKVTWPMSVSSVTSDGWLRVHQDGATEWWVRASDTTLIQGLD